MVVVPIAAERVYGQAPDGDQVGLTDFCTGTFFEKTKGGCILWGMMLSTARQSFAITTTYASQYIMHGLLNIHLLVVV